MKNNFWIIILILIQINFIILNLLGLLSWTWWVVFLPILIPVVTVLSAILFFFVFIPFAAKLLK